MGLFTLHKCLSKSRFPISEFHDCHCNMLKENGQLNNLPNDNVREK